MASRVVLSCRKLLGRPAQAQFVRDGIRWQLDLREGIDFSIYLLGSFEPATVRAYRRIVKPGQTVLDIGANIGAHTLPLARLVGPGGRVIAFEPTAFAARKLAANVALNAHLAARISLHQVMLVARKTDSLPPAVYSSWPLFEAEALHAKHRGRLMDTAGARPATLDELVAEMRLSEVHFIKLDVDGHEVAVLQGAGESLSRFRPVIALELAPYLHAEHGHSFEALVLLLTGAGYRLHDIAGLEPLPSEPSELRRIVPDGRSINALAIPA
jgi:FkbM family methyltransferase